jgi:hypothetical protein
MFWSATVLPACCHVMQVLLRGTPDWPACLGLVTQVVNASAPCGVQEHAPACVLGTPQPKLQGNFMALTGVWVFDTITVTVTVTVTVTWFRIYPPLGANTAHGVPGSCITCTERVSRSGSTRSNTCNGSTNTMES